MGSPASRGLGSSAGEGSEAPGIPVRTVGMVCRRKGSSIFIRFFTWRLSRPAAHQGGGYQRQEQFVMASDCVAGRRLCLAATRGSCGAPHYILQRTVVLNKVEVGSGDRAKRKAQVAHDGDGFQENLWEQNGGAPIQIDAAGVHLLHQGAEEAEIAIRDGRQRARLARWGHGRSGVA